MFDADIQPPSEISQQHRRVSSVEDEASHTIVRVNSSKHLVEQAGSKHKATGSNLSDSMMDVDEATPASNTTALLYTDWNAQITPDEVNQLP